MSTNKIVQIELSKLIEHPDNPNKMSSITYRKLVRNIEATGRYEPIVVRAQKQRQGFYQIINGQHRCKALKQLGLQSAECVVWDVDDAQTEILLATLNRLCGSDVLDKKISLLNKLKANFDSQKLSKLVPYTKNQIEKLTGLKSLPAAGSIVNSFAKPLVFFVTVHQSEIIEKALSLANRRDTKATRPARRAAALAKIAKKYLGK